jgi:hypothetical protein
MWVTAPFWFDNLSDKSVMRIGGRHVFRRVLLSWTCLNKTVLSGHVARHTVEYSGLLIMLGLRTGARKLYTFYFNKHLTINTRTRSPCFSTLSSYFVLYWKHWNAGMRGDKQRLYTGDTCNLKIGCLWYHLAAVKSALHFRWQQGKDRPIRILLPVRQEICLL